MVAPGVPAELGDEAVVLVPVRERVREDQVRVELALEILEALLDPQALPRQEAVAERERVQPLGPVRAQEAERALPGLAQPRPVGAEHGPVDLRARRPLEQPQQRPAAADLDVVAVRADAQHERPILSPQSQAELPHQAALRPCWSTRHGASPPASSSSSSCRSLKVSRQCQKPS